MSTAVVVGTLRLREDVWELVAVGIYSEDPWHMTRQFGADVMFVQMSPAISGSSFGDALTDAKQFVVAQYPNLDRDLLMWDAHPPKKSDV